jgi:hypothetical protein
VLSRAGYYACMRSGSFAAGSRAGVCSVSRAITHACAAVAPRPRRERTGAVTRGLLRMHAQRDLRGRALERGCVPSRELLRMHAQQSPRGRDASGRVLSRAGYYACMRSGSFRAGLSSEGCVPSRELLRMHAQQSPRGRDASGRVLSRAGYYACMRSETLHNGLSSAARGRGRYACVRNSSAERTTRDAREVTGSRASAAPPRLRPLGVIPRLDAIRPARGRARGRGARSACGSRSRAARPRRRPS